VGVVTDTDLMGLGRHTPFALKSAVARAPTATASPERWATSRRSIATLVESSADPVDIGHVIAFSIDAATRRLLELGIAELGEPSVRVGVARARKRGAAGAGDPHRPGPRA
jgi:CBS domain-containing protein